MATKKITIPVGFQFDDVTGELTNVKKSLSNIKINTNLGDSYAKAFSRAEKEIEKLQQRAARGFSSQSDIDAYNTGLNSVLDALERIQTLSGKIKFTDLNLNADQIKQFNSLKNSLAGATQILSNFKRSQINSLFEGNEQFATTMKDIVGLTEQTYKDQGQLTSRINDTTKSLQSQGEQYQKNLDLVQAQLAAFQALQKTSGIEGLASQYGRQNKEGKWSFSANQADTGRAALLDYGKQNGVFSDEDIKRLTTAGASLQTIVNTYNNQLSAAIQKATQEQKNYLEELEKNKTKLEAVKTAMEALDAALNNGSMQEAKKAYEDANAALEQFKESTVAAAQAQAHNVAQMGASTGALKGYKAELSSFRSQLETMQSADNLFNSLTSSVKQLVGFGAVLTQVRRGIQLAVSQIQELDSAMNGISVVTNMSTAELWGQINTYMAIAKQYGVTTEGTYQVSQLYYQMGLDTNSVMELTTETLKMAKIANLDYASATDYMTTAMNGFQLSAADAGRIVDVYSKLAGIAATDTSELAVAMSKTAAIANSAGMSFEATSAMLTQMIESTREAPEALGTSLKTVIARMQEMKSNPTQLIEVDGETVSLNKMDTALSSVGISLKDASGQFRNLDEVIFELSKIWDTLDRNTQRWIANTASGSRQQSRFISLLSDSERLQELYTAALDSEDAALVQYSKSLDSMESKLNQLSTSFQQFYMQIFNGETLKAAVEYLTQFVDKLNEVGPVGAIAIVGSLVSALGSIGMAMSTKIAAAYKVSKEFLDGRKAEIQAIGDSWWDGFVANFVPKVQTATNQAVQILQNAQGQIQGGTSTPTTTGTPHRRSGRNDGRARGNVPSVDALNDAAKGGNKYADAAKGLVSGLTKLAPAISLISTLLYSNADAADKASVTIARLGSFAKIGAGIAQVYSGQVVSGITTIVSGLAQLIGLEETAGEKLARLKKDAEKANIARAESKTNLTTLDSTYKKYIRLRDAQYESNEAYEEWINYNQQIINDYPELATTYDSQGNLIVKLAEKYDALKQSADLAYKSQKKISQDADVEVASQPLYKFTAAGVGDQSKKDVQGILNAVGKATNQEEAKNFLFQELTGMSYDEAIDEWEKEFGNQSYAEALDSSPLRIPSYLAMPKRLAELMDSDNPRQYWEDNNFESTILGGFSLDDFLNITGHYSEILQSGSSTLYKNASTNIEETVDALDEAYNETQKQLLRDWLQNQLDTIYTAGELTTDIFTSQYDVTAIEDTVKIAANQKFGANGQFANYTKDQLKKIQDFQAGLSTHSLKDFENFEYQDALTEIYGITSENFIDPIELYISRIAQISEAVDKGLTNSTGKFIDERIYQSLSNLPIAFLSTYFESLSQLLQQTNLGDNKDEIINDYIDLFSQLSSLNLDYSTLSSLLTDADFSTRSGVLAFADALTKAGINLSESGIDLNKTANLIPVTMADAQQGLASLQTSMASAADIIKNLQGSDNEKKLAAYNTLSTLGISTDRISALAMGEDLTGDITQEVYDKYIAQQKANLEAIIDSLYNAKGTTDEQRTDLDAIRAMIAAFDKEVAEAAGTRATNIVSLILSQMEDVLGGKAPTLSRNDVNTLAAYAPNMVEMLEQTGSDTWTLKAGVTTKQWATAVAGLAGSVTEPGYELITALINASGKEWTKAVDNADLENFIAPMLDAVSDSGDITFGEDLYKFLSEHVSQDIIDKFDSSKDGLTALTGLYDFDGTVKEWLDMVQKIIEELFPSYSKEFAKWREKNEYGLNQSREYKQAQDKMDKVHQAEESTSAMADIILKMKNMEASTDDATEAVRRFNLEYTDLVQLADGKWGLSTAGQKKLGLDAQIVSVEDYRDEIAQLKKDLLSAQRDSAEGSQEEANRIKALIALREQELKLLNEKNQLVSQNADDYNTLLDAPENYAKNILSYADELKSAAKTGYIEISTLSNVINNLGPASNTVKALSKQLNVDLLENGTANIVALTDALYSTKKLSTIDGKPMVQIGSAMANMLQGAAKLDLKDVAQQNIDMLDGMIATLESLEALGDAEIDSDLKVDMLTEATFTDEKTGQSFTSFNALWEKFKETAENNPDLWIQLASHVTADIQTEEGQRQLIDFLLSNQSVLQSMGVKAKTIDEDLILAINTVVEDGMSKEAAENAVADHLKITTEELQKRLDREPATINSTTKVNTVLEEGTTTDNRGRVNDPNGQLLAEQTSSAAMTEYLATRKTAQATAVPAIVPVQLDTTLADQFMDKLQQRIEEPKVTPLTVDPTQGEKTVEQTVQFVERQRPELTIGGDSAPAVGETKSLLNYVNSQTGQIQIYGADNVTPLVDQIINNLSGRSVDIQVNMSSQSYKSSGSSKRDQDKKNKKYSALANGSEGVPNTGKALVGELGPEMVVQGNTYRVVGQYGAEFVNLKRGDVVFNASDTARLMKNKDGVRGTALVNGTGPAYGSGLKGAIKSLKEARAAWSSILNSVPDMLKKGSGGGGGSDKADKEYLMQLEKWFNWLRRIEELENRITVLRAKRENLKDGKQYADSLYEENAYLKKQSDLYAGLIAEQKAYRKQLQDDYLKNYSKYFYFIGDAIQINADAILADTKNNEELGEKIQDLIDDYKDVTEQITENTSKLEENKTQMDENIRTLRDKYIEMENEVLNALKSMYQKEIDAKQKALDEMKEADDAYLDSLKKNLDKEKSLRDKSKAQQEKQTLQRKIALLSRDTSGANAKELADLRQQLRDMQEDQYFSDREDAITSAENATQAQQDALQKEIDSLNEANQIKLDNMQLYWEEVQNIINQGSENILSFLKSYSDSYLEVSKIQQEDYTSSWKQTIDAALEYAKDMQKQFDEIIAAATEALRKSNTNTTGELLNSDSSSGSSGGGSSGSSGGSSGSSKKSNSHNKNNAISSVIQNVANALKKKPSSVSKATKQMKYATGGVVDYTGLAWVDGTPSKPETFLSAADTNLLANFLKAAHSLNFGLSSSSVRSSVSSAPTVNVDTVEINITQAELKDDADISKLSQDLSQKFLMDIARQSGNISISRR
jgi:TP901 family phage tail tape measure protein